MGTHFANIHIQTHQLEEVLKALQEVNPYSNQEIMGHFLKNTYVVGEYKRGWISVLNDFFAWGEVSSFAEELSSYLPFPVLAIGYFDDDVFEMNVFVNGSESTAQIWCSDGVREDYGLEDKEADISILAELVGHEHIDAIYQLLSMTDCEQAVHALQHIIQIPLWLRSDWLDTITDKELAQKYIEYNFNSH